MRLKIKAVVLSVLMLSFWATQASAEFDTTRMHAGGGFGMNDIDGPADSAVGFQIFWGYDFDFKLADKFDTSVEVGYMDSGDFDYTTPAFPPFIPAQTFSVNATGLWSTAIASYQLNEQFSALGRLGLDFGDDDGIMLGIGGQFDISPVIAARLEYVIRGDINSLQANVIYRFK